MNSIRHHIVIGAGPAGLTAAWHLARQGEPVTILEKEDAVGGLARSIEFEGHWFDIGPHRFYTKSAAIESMWDEMLPDGFTEVERLTRIYYGRKFYGYPIQLRETLRNLGARRSLAVLGSWAKARVRPRRPVVSFEDWIVNAFGGELYRTFFKTYTEKVWGVPCSQIDKDWAAQRIRGLSLVSAVRNALVPASRRGRVKSLVERFRYPSGMGGAGSLWHRVLRTACAHGAKHHSGADVSELHHDGERIRAIVTRGGQRLEGTHFHVTMPLREIVQALRPAPPPRILEAGAALRHRDFIVVGLVLGTRDVFPDQWIYVHDSDVRVARITNFENWGETSPTGHAPATRLLLEYFENRGQPLWQLDDGELVELARAELVRIGLLPNDPSLSVRGFARRIENAYPIYDRDYASHRETLKQWLGVTFDNLWPAGRGGLHNYNSQDHAMMSATLAVRNATEGTAFDLWSINTEAEYAEEGPGQRAEIEERLVPKALR